MEELLLAAGICLLLGSSIFLYYYPFITILALAATCGTTIHWWKKKKLLLAKKENITQRLEKVKKHPEIEQVFIPDFEKKIKINLKELKNILQKNEHEVMIEMINDLNDNLKTDILTHKTYIIEMLDSYINTNHRVISSEIKITKEKISTANETHSKNMLLEILSSLTEKQSLYQANKKQIIHFYSQIKKVLLQIDNMKLKSNNSCDKDQLALSFKNDFSKTLSQFNDANEILDEINKLDL
ncbi:MAG: hypothetical protein COB02_08000 [Candidatus Cloacimonadota bacterium]|nr:MAG: hypothetical protein COB02_08000 [Candidatus Cloacimonadota bacterium]